MQEGRYMCGRYYVDPDTEDEIRKIVNTAEEKIKIIQGDVFPSQRAAVITSSRWHGGSRVMLVKGW